MHIGTSSTLLSTLSILLISTTSAASARDYTTVNQSNALSDYQVNELLISQAAKKKDSKKGSSSKKSSSKKSDKKTKDKEEFKVPVITDAVDVNALTLVSKPKTYMGKNVKFKSNFFAFSNLALNYKPAFRSQKKYISFLVYRPKTKIPLSELKLAMKIPKEKDPRNKMLTTLQDGDTVEITGKVFSTALDEPWIDVLNLKKLASAKKKKDKDNEKAESKK